MRIEGQGFAAQITRSQRKTLCITIRRGEVCVRAPLRLPLAQILRFVDQKAPWINNVLERQQQMPSAVPRTFVDGETFLLLGRTLTLRVEEGKKPAVVVDGDDLVLTMGAGGNTDQRIKALSDWYRQSAREYFIERCAYFGEQLGLRPQGIKIRIYKSRWGSCNHRGELQFNWLLLMAPPEVVDYVVVHELCHLRHFNHSPEFWQLVMSILPNYQQQRQWLKQQNCLYWQ